MRDRLQIVIDLINACEDKHMTAICKIANVNQTVFKSMMKPVIANGWVKITKAILKTLRMTKKRYCC